MYLCKACISVFDEIRTSQPEKYLGTWPEFSVLDLHPARRWHGQHHSDLNSLINSARSKCYLCCQILQQAGQEVSSQTDRIQTLYDYRLIPGPGPLGCVIFEIRGAQGNLRPLPADLIEKKVTFRTIPFEDVISCTDGRDIPSNTSNERCIDQIRGWFSNCVDTHKKCNIKFAKSHPHNHASNHDHLDLAAQSGVAEVSNSSVPFCPARLLALDSYDVTGSCRLLESASETPRGVYATLSHRWGRTTCKTLLKSTLQAWKKEILPHELSQTFKDAIAIASCLGIRYLWIDALCIMQDDAEDWRREASLMKDVYSNSHLTIAATAAATGCFRERNPSWVKPCLIHNMPAKDTPWRVGRDNTVVISPMWFWDTFILDAPLYRRAWALQERLFSRRIVHFAEGQIFWECSESMACETYPQGVPDEAIKSTEAPTRDLDSLSRVRFFLDVFATTNGSSGPTITDLEQFWISVVVAYMKGALTFQKDKLVAISGIARRLAEPLRMQYLAGLWLNERLPTQLLWYVEDLKQVDGSPSQRLSPYQAPSWSWASLNAQIHWLEYSQDFADYQQIFVDVSKAETVPLTDDPMGEIVSGSLNVRGHLLPARIEKALLDEGAAKDDFRGKLFIRSMDAVYRMEVNIVADYVVTVDEHTMNGYGTTKIEMSRQNGAAIYLDTPFRDEGAIEVALLPVCMPWTNGKAADNWRVAGLILQRRADAVDEESLVFSRIGLFAFSNSGFEAKYGFDGRGFDLRWKESLEVKDVTIV